MSNYNLIKQKAIRDTEQQLAKAKKNIETNNSNNDLFEASIIFILFAIAMIALVKSLPTIN